MNIVFIKFAYKFYLIKQYFHTNLFITQDLQYIMAGTRDDNYRYITFQKYIEEMSK